MLQVCVINKLDLEHYFPTNINISDNVNVTQVILIPFALIRNCYRNWKKRTEYKIYYHPIISPQNKHY